jgi:tetratricopeptide (TPR) repeat protein
MNNPNKKAVSPKLSPKKTPESGPFHFHGNRFHIVFVLVVVIFSFMLYGNGISNGYSLDDEFVLHNDSIVKKGISGIPKLFKLRYAWDQKGSYGYRPVVKASFAVEYQFLGKTPHTGHVVNILLYALLCIFIFYFMRRLLYERVSDMFLFVMLAIFITHPLHTEVVDSLKNRDALLSFLFGLFSSYCFIRGFDGKNIIIKLLWIAGGCLSLQLGILSKPDAYIFAAITPLILYFFDKSEWKNALITSLILCLTYWIILKILNVHIFMFSGYVVISSILVIGSLLYRTRFERWKKVMACLVFMATAFFLLALVQRHILPRSNYHRTFIFIEEPLMGTHWYQRIALGFSSLWFYIQKLIFPLNMICYYGYDEFHPFPSWISFDVIMGIIVAGGLLYLIYKNFKNKNGLLFTFLFFGGTMATFLNVLQVGPGIVAERFMLVPSLGFALLVAYLLYYVFKLDLKFRPTSSKTTSLYMVVGIACLIYSARTIARNPDWKSHLSIYEHDGKIAIRSAKLQSLLGSSYIQHVQESPNMPPDEKAKYYQLGEKAYLNSIAVYPEYATSLNNLGMIQFSYYKNYDKAMEYFMQALKCDTTYTEALFNIGATYQLTGKNDLAEYYFLKAIKVNPQYFNTYIYLSRLYFTEGKLDKVLQFNQDAIDNGHLSDVVYVNMGNVYLFRKDTATAAEYLEKAVSYYKLNYNLCSFLANYYSRHRDMQKAQYYGNLYQDGLRQSQQVPESNL